MVQSQPGNDVRGKHTLNTLGREGDYIRMVKWISSCEGGKQTQAGNNRNERRFKNFKIKQKTYTVGTSISM